jgi:hypothetical protein
VSVLLFERSLENQRVVHRPHSQRVLAQPGHRRDVRDRPRRQHQPPVGDADEWPLARADIDVVLCAAHALQPLVHHLDRQSAQHVGVPEFGELGTRSPGGYQIEFGEGLLIGARVDEHDLDAIRGLHAMGQRHDEGEAGIPAADHDHPARVAVVERARVDSLHPGELLRARPARYA